MLHISKQTHTVQTYLPVLLNLSAAALSAVGTAISFAKYGVRMFLFYTVDSNIFAMLACTVYALFLCRRIRTGKALPTGVIMTKYAAVCCLSVTFLVVIAVLAPMYGLQGYRIMLLTDDMLYHHLLCPLLAFFSFFCFDRVPLAAAKAARFAMLPTAIYAVILVTLNFLKLVEGPYPFLRIYRQPAAVSVLWLVVILGGSYGIAWLAARLRQPAD